MDSKRNYQLRKSRVVGIVVGDRHYYSYNSDDPGEKKKSTQDIQ